MTTTIALEDDHRALAESVAGFARRHAPLETTRARFDDLAAGKPTDAWTELVRQGLHAVHLSEEHGGAGAGLPELAVVAEQLAKAMVPGPWLPTVIAGAVLTDAALLTSFAEGATGVLVLDGLTAESHDGGWRVTGTSLPTLGLPGADAVVVRAMHGAEALWFRLRPDTGTVHVDAGVDLTRAIGRLELEAYDVKSDEALDAPDPLRLDLVLITLLAAEAAGIAKWAVETSVEYAKTRVQFDRPIGSFQAVQHKAALMLVRAETAAAAAWDAARVEQQPADQWPLAAAQAAVTALPAAVDVSLDCVTLLGGIGFTWEHDAHLYWRRAISIATIAGPEDRWALRLGEAALTASRDFTFVDADAQPELRARVAEVLDEVLAMVEGEEKLLGWGPSGGGPRQVRLAEAGLVAPHYPAPYGVGAGAEEQAVIADEYARRGLRQPTTMIGEWVLPTLLVHGTEDQQTRFVGSTLRGEISWCQLFSEPGAGSDLASLATRARKVDGGWMLDGQKVWTSKAHEADWGVCLARTDPDVPKHKGISYFLVDMRSSGVDIRPLRQATGHAEFNEVFLDEVFVPDECLVGAINEGWKLAVTTLSSERLSMGARLSHGSAEHVRALLERDAGVDREDGLRVLGRNTARENALSAINLRNVLARISGLDVGASISVQKVFNSMAQREGSRALLSLLGPAGAVIDEGSVMDHLILPAVLLGGGTIEIQLNVIAQRVLGLPR